MYSSVEEQWTFNPKALGSIPSTSIFFIKKIVKTKIVKKFALHGKKVFQTYSQCRLSRQSVLAQLQGILAAYELENYLLTK